MRFLIDPQTLIDDTNGYQIGHSGNKVLTSFSKSEDEVRSVLVVVTIFSKKFCELDLQAVQYL